VLDSLSRWVVLLGYVSVLANAGMLVHKLQPNWYRRVALYVALPAAAFWVCFYISVTFFDAGSSLAHWSRVGHTLTLGAFLAQQFLIGTATVKERTKVASAASKVKQAVRIDT